MIVDVAFDAHPTKASATAISATRQPAVTSLLRSQHRHESREIPLPFPARGKGCIRIMPGAMLGDLPGRSHAPTCGPRASQRAKSHSQGIIDDGAADQIIVNGTPTNDVITASGEGGTISVTGLTAILDITEANAARRLVAVARFRRS